ncbi:hypothetical protein [Pseudoalteromonas xiamenensis]
MKYVEKYKHYISLTVALLFYVYVTDPFHMLTEEVVGSYSLQSKRLAKTEALLNNATVISEELNKATVNKNAMEKFFFNAESEGQFKLQIQQRLDYLLRNSECNLDTLTWLDEKKNHGTNSSMES